MLTTTILACALSALANPVGYYRQPTMHADTIVFVSEGDLWKVPAGGGVASRLTSHPGDESSPKISPDGKQVAFVGIPRTARERSFLSRKPVTECSMMRERRCSSRAFRFRAVTPSDTKAALLSNFGD